MACDKTYFAIDLKSFYASVECMERGLDPMTTNLVVADISRTEKTICLAVSPSLKAYGISGRARLFQVVERVREVNCLRKMSSPGGKFSGESYDAPSLAADPSLALSYIVAPPRMSHYIEHSTRIFKVYIKYIAPEDIHVYSIDEVLIDATPYLKSNGMTPRAFVSRILKDVLETTGITATAGIGSNLYLAKVAMDIVAKHADADENGVRIGELDEMSYRRLLWTHKPITDFWRIGNGYAAKLASHGMYTMGDVARCSLGKANQYHNENLLYKLFGVNAELLIDHAWGYEPCTIQHIKTYKPESSSMVSGQVLQNPYSADKARLVIREIADAMSLDLVSKGLVTDQLVMTLGYDIENITDPAISREYTGPVVTDRYGRKIPKHSHGTINLGRKTSSTRIIANAAVELYDRIVNSGLLLRRISITANNLTAEDMAEKAERYEQLNLFTDYVEEIARAEEEAIALAREKRVQRAVVDIKEKYGKNAILKGMNLQEGATAMDRNGRIGGHRA